MNSPKSDWPSQKGHWRICASLPVASFLQFFWCFSTWVYLVQKSMGILKPSQYNSKVARQQPGQPCFRANIPKMFYLNWFLGLFHQQYCWWFRNSLSPVDMANIPLFTGSYTSQVVQDFFHQQFDLLNRNEKEYEDSSPRVLKHEAFASNWTVFHRVAVVGVGISSSQQSIHSSNIEFLSVSKLGGGFKYFLFSPRSLGKIPILTNILKPSTSIEFQMIFVTFTPTNWGNDSQSDLRIFLGNDSQLYMEWHGAPNPISKINGILLGFCFTPIRRFPIFLWFFTPRNSANCRLFTGDVEMQTRSRRAGCLDSVCVRSDGGDRPGRDVAEFHYFLWHFFDILRLLYIPWESASETRHCT